MKLKIILLFVSFYFAEIKIVHAANTCGDIFMSSEITRHYKPYKKIPFDMPGLQVATVNDSSLSTGSTLFYFPRGAHASFDSRGGSVASIETTLLEEGSYSNQIDAVVFSGGSTMGLAATDGVRRVLYQQRQNGESFDFIPSVPGAVVYDFGFRLAPINNQRLYPDSEMGAKLMENLDSNTFPVGRVGAGVNTTCAKICNPRWGGQGMASGSINLEIAGKKTNARIFTAVVLNPVGDIVEGQKSISQSYKEIVPKTLESDSGKIDKNSLVSMHMGHKKNTTLSIVVTDFSLDRNQLRRIAVMVHTSMAAHIYPFHGSTDGDILFAVTTGKNLQAPEGIEEAIAMEASKLMGEAIRRSVDQSNDPL